MKRILLVLLILANINLVSSESKTRSLKRLKTGTIASWGESFRQVLKWSFHTELVHLLELYYDYLRGSYASTPIGMQPEEHGGGIYLAYHVQQSIANPRKVYYSHISPNDEITTTRSRRCRIQK